jgi:hypothetical protein
LIQLTGSRKGVGSLTEDASVSRSVKPLRKRRVATWCAV